MSAVLNATKTIQIEDLILIKCILILEIILKIEAQSENLHPTLSTIRQWTHGCKKGVLTFHLLLKII